ncbi:hypothetical protein Tco_0570730 [Tanacetum coccineum]
MPTGRKFTLGEQCPLTRFTQSKVVHVKQPENVSTERLSNTSQKPLTSYFRLQPAFQSKESMSPKRQLFLLTDNMAKENIHAPTPTRSDDQILPFNAWVPIRMSNCVLDIQKKQRNLIFQISFWNTLSQEAKTGAYRFQLDEDWFTLDANLLRQALEITLIDQAQQFVSPPSGDAIMDFVNELGYPEEIHFVSRMAVNNLYQPWRAILLMINQSNHLLFGKKARLESPLNLAEDDYRLGTLKFVPKGEKDEVFGMQVPKELITDNIMNAPYYNAYMEMVAKHNRKTAAEERGNMKSGSKADQSKKPATAKQPNPVLSKPSKPAPANKPKVAQEKPSDPSPAKQPKKSVVRKVRKRKNHLQLIDEEELAQPQPDPELSVDDFELHIEQAIQMSLKSFQAPGQAPVGGVTIRECVAEATRQLLMVEDKGKGIATDEQAALSLLDLHKPKKKSTIDQYILQRHTAVTKDASTRPSMQPEDDTSTNIVRDNPSPTDVETEADTDITTSTANTEILYAEDAQDPSKTRESRPPPGHEHMDEDQARPNPRQSHVALAGPNPEPVHEDFITTVCPKVNESLKHTTEEHVHLDNPLSSSGTLSSMKNLDDTFTFDDHFLNDKPIEEEPGKATMETKAESMATVPIHQASTSVPPLSTPIIDHSPPKQVSSSLQEPFITATTEATITTLSLLPPPPPQSIEVINLVSRILAVEKRSIDLEQKILNQDKTINALGSRVYALENHDLYSKFDKQVNEVVKEAVHDALQEPEHEALYKALEASIDLDYREEFFADKVKSRKRHHDDQDPPPLPPKDSDRSKKKRHESDSSGSHQPQGQQSSSWQISNTREAPAQKSSSSSKQKQTSPSVQPINEDIPILDDVNISDLEDTSSAHLTKITTKVDWFKPVPEEDTPASPEPDWVIPLNDLPKAENNSADALAKTYKDPDENKLLSKTRDMGSFIKWYCRRIGKKKLTKADLEGPAYMTVKLFHTNNISLQFQMEECHMLLIDKIDLVNPEGHRIVPDVTNSLPLGGPPGQVTIQPHFFFNKDLDYLVSGDKERRNALSISKLKVAHYLDFRLEELVLSLWIESECHYDISAAYGITHWCFKQKEFYIQRHNAPSNCHAVRSHMQILSVTSLKTSESYGYTYLREIVLRRADYNEYKILEADFKNLHPNDFEDLYLLHLQGKLNHLPRFDKVHLFNAINMWIRDIIIRLHVGDLQLGIESYQTNLNLTQPDWDASDFLFKEDYTIVSKPRSIIYRDRNDQKMMMRLNEVHKFSDGTLTRVLEKLDHMVKDFKLFEYNRGMKNMIWSEDDKRRSEESIEENERRLKIRRIFRSLESFVGGRIRDIDYRLISRTEVSEYKDGKVRYDKRRKGENKGNKGNSAD